MAVADLNGDGGEEIRVIAWTGEQKQLAGAKERHEQGDVCIFESATGRMVRRFPEKAARLLVVDVSGDWREEIIVVSGNQIRIYWNDRPKTRPNYPRL